MNPDETFGLAEAALRRGDGAGAERVITQQWRDLATAPGDALHIMAMVRLSQNNGAQAVQFMRGAVRAEPDSLRHNIALGQILSSTKDDEGAADAFAAAARIDPNWPGVHLVLSMANYKGGRFAQAESAARAAVAAAPSTESWEALSDALRAQGKGQEALSAAEEALKLDRENFNALNCRGAALLMLDRPKEALQVFDALAAKGIEAPVLALNRGEALEKLGRQAEARVLYDSAARRWPHLPNVQERLKSRRG